MKTSRDRLVAVTCTTVQRGRSFFRPLILKNALEGNFVVLVGKVLKKVVTHLVYVCSHTLETVLVKL